METADQGTCELKDTTVVTSATVATTTTVATSTTDTIDIIGFYLDRNHGYVLRRYLNNYDRAVLFLACTGFKDNIKDNTKDSLRHIILDWIASLNAFLLPPWMNIIRHVHNPFAEYLVKCEYLKLFQWLLDTKIMILIPEETQLLYDAISAGNIGMIKLLWKYGVCCKHKRNGPFEDLYGDPCIRSAMLRGHNTLAERLAWHGLYREYRPKASLQIISERVLVLPLLTTVEDYQSHYEPSMSCSCIEHPNQCRHDLVAPTDILNYTKLQSEINAGDVKELLRTITIPYVRDRDKIAAWGACGNILKLDIAFMSRKNNAIQEITNMWFGPAAERGQVGVIEWGVGRGIITYDFDCGELLTDSLSHGHTNVADYLMRVGKVETVHWPNMLDSAIESKNMHVYRYIRDKIFELFIVCRITNVHTYDVDAVLAGGDVPKFTSVSLNMMTIDSRPRFYSTEHCLSYAVGTGIIELAEDVQNTFCTNHSDGIYSSAIVSNEMIQWVHDRVYKVSDYEFADIVYIKDYRNRFRAAEKLYSLGCKLSVDSLRTILEHGDIGLCEWLRQRKLVNIDDAISINERRDMPGRENNFTPECTKWLDDVACSRDINDVRKFEEVTKEIFGGDGFNTFLRYGLAFSDDSEEFNALANEWFGENEHDGQNDDNTECSEAECSEAE